MSGGIGLLIIIAFVALILLWFVFYFIPIGLWFSALVSGVRISLLQLVLMRFRKVPPSVIVNQLIAGTKAGLHLQANDLEAHFLAGGNVPECGNRADFGAESQYRTRFQDGCRYRSGRS